MADVQTTPQNKPGFHGLLRRTQTWMGAAMLLALAVQGADILLSDDDKGEELCHGLQQQYTQAAQTLASQIVATDEFMLGEVQLTHRFNAAETGAWLPWGGESCTVTVTTLVPRP